MIKSLEQRKNELVKELEEKYIEKPDKGVWGDKNDACKSTKIVAYESYINDYFEQDIVVQNEFDFYRVEFAIFFIGACVTLTLSYITPTIFWIVVGLLLTIKLYFLYKTATAKRIFVIITNDGIQLENEPFIGWGNVIASYVLIDGKGEETNYYLLMYHHNTITDEFMCTKYKFESKGMNYQDICFFIEYWNTKTTKK